MPVYLDGDIGFQSALSCNPLAPPPPSGPSELVLSGVGGYATTSDFTLVDATALDVQILLTGTDYTPAASRFAWSQRDLDNQAYAALFTTAGALQFTFGNTAGAFSTSATARTPSPALVDGSPIGFRVTWSGTTVRYYLADDPTDPETTWTQVGADVTIASLSPGGTAPVRVGAGAGGTNRLLGSVRSARFLKNAVLVASPDFTAQSPGTTSFDDAQGNTWTLSGTAAIEAQ